MWPLIAPPSFTSQARPLPRCFSPPQGISYCPTSLGDLQNNHSVPALELFVCGCYFPSLSPLSAARTKQFRAMSKALQESKAARENVWVVARVCATFPVQDTPWPRCSVWSWAAPDGQQPTRAQVARGYRVRSGVRYVTASLCIAHPAQ